MHETADGGDSDIAGIEPESSDGAENVTIETQYTDTGAASPTTSSIATDATGNQDGAAGSADSSGVLGESQAQAPPEQHSTEASVAPDSAASDLTAPGVQDREADPDRPVDSGSDDNGKSDRCDAEEPEAAEHGDYQVDDMAPEERGDRECDDTPVGDTAELGDERLREMSETLNDVRRRVGELARLGERNADHVAALHTENQRLRNGELRAALNPMVRDLIRVYDDVERLAGLDDVHDGHLRIVASLLIDTLARWDVFAYTPEVGDEFDTAVHSGVVRIATTEPISNTIAGVRRCGFRMDGRVLRTADVEVYRQDPPTDSRESGTTTTVEVPT